MKYTDLPDVLALLRRGTVIPAHLLALDASRRLDARRQRALSRTGGGYRRMFDSAPTAGARGSKLATCLGRPTGNDGAEPFRRTGLVPAG